MERRWLRPALVALVLAGAAIANGILVTGCAFTCDASSCPDGCCDSSGVCNTGADDSHCGSAGGLCTSCSYDQTCDGTTGTCEAKCNPTNCANGCCSYDTCITDLNDSECGLHGAACALCDYPKICNTSTGSCGGRDASTCPTGCCDSAGSCRTDENDTDCGTSGASCDDCLQTTDMKCGASKSCVSCVPFEGTCSTSDECCTDMSCKPSGGGSTCQF